MALGQPARGPSAVSVAIPGMEKLFAVPQALTEAEIEGIIQRYVNSAKLAEQAGFTGVQIHAAHGYLFSQFLSPLINQRSDQWGGTLENRARILLRTVDAVRATVSRQFCVAVKLNSADFQRGGFAVDDAIAVVQMLNERAVDLIELSGGSYESPAMQGQSSDGSTLAREAYFLAFAEHVQQVARMPALQPDLPRRWRSGERLAVEPVRVDWKNRTLASVATQAIVKKQLVRLSQGKPTNVKVSPLLALVTSQLKIKRQSKRYRRWVADVDQRN